MEHSAGRKSVAFETPRLGGLGDGELSQLEVFRWGPCSTLLDGAVKGGRLN